MNYRERWTVAADGASLAFWDEGDGPALVLTNGFANSTLYWEPVRMQLRQHWRIVRWDLRGHGRSGAVRDLDTMTVAGCADDLRRVLDAAGIERAVLAGFSFGTQIILEAWRQFPERIDGLIPTLGPYESPFDTLIHPAVGPLIYKLYEAIPPAVWGTGLKLGALGPLLRPVHMVAREIGFVGADVTLDEMEPFYTHLAGIDIPSWYVMGRAAQEHSASDILADIDVPSLVIAGGSDRFSPGEVGRQMARQMPNAELLWLEEATHTGLFDERERIGDAIQNFMQSVYAGAQSSRAAAGSG